MKVLCKCGKFYLSEDTVCPVCGHALTADECAEALKEQEDYQRAAKERQRKGMSEWPRDKAVRQELRRMRRERKEAEKKPVSAVLISTEDNRSSLGTVIHAIACGGLLGLGRTGGPTHATFSVMYANGRVAMETVEVKGKRFEELSALLHK